MPLIETEGVDVVPESDRTREFWQLFAIWAGFTIVITNFLLGSLTVTAGLVTGFAAAVLSILLVGVIVYLGTKIAALEGTAGTTAMRAPFGVQGRFIPSLAMVIATVGWFGVQTGIVASSAQQILANVGISVSFAVLAAILGLLMASVAIFGYEWIEWLNKIAVPFMTVLLALVVYQIVTNYSTDLSAGGGDMTFWAALNVFPAATAAFLIVAMDYGRYGTSEEPDRPSLGASVAWIAFAIALAAIGVVAAAAAGTWNPVDIMVELGLGSVGLLLLVAGSWTTNVTNVYAGGIALSQITGLQRVYMTTLTGLIGTGLAIAGIFSFGGITSFLSALTITLVPTTGVLLVHYYLFERGLDEDELFRSEGRYWYLRGWNPTAVGAWLVGAAFAVFAPDYLVPALSSAVVAGAIYYVVKRPVDEWIESRSRAGEPAD
ncbi:purine-cytosine permease family protein [Halegenticoccus tardaugens]|uniref:purine-cytosine permease family protein n=1 Tax=Halegenticoccus tardaugens TaxID=2071624 RepID=UPI0013E9378F|nr:cytosine permease [Halegenticoccus tardaugens]